MKEIRFVKNYGVFLETIRKKYCRNIWNRKRKEAETIP